MTLLKLLYLISLYSNVSGRRSTTAGGLLVAMIAIGTSIGNLIAGLYIRRFGRLKALLIASLIVSFVVTIMIRFRWSGTESMAEGSIEIMICGVCNGIGIGALLVGLLRSVDSTGESFDVSNPDNTKSLPQRRQQYMGLFISVPQSPTLWHFRLLQQSYSLVQESTWRLLSKKTMRIIYLRQISPRYILRISIDPMLGH